MKRRVLSALLLLLIVSLLQANVLSVIRIVGISALLPLAIAVVTALLRRSFESTLMGFLYGMVYDMLLGRNLGFHALMYAAVAAGISLVNEKLYREKHFIQIVFSFSAVLVTETLFYLALFLLKGYATFSTVFVTVVLPAALFTAIIALPLYTPLRVLYTRLDRLDRKHSRIGVP